MNIHIEMPVNEMTDDNLIFAKDKLENALKTINAECTRRREVRKANAWENVMKAIKNYTAEFGDIKVETASTYWMLTNWNNVGIFEAYD